MTYKKSICFVGSANYPVVAKLKTNEVIGGESVQQTLIARAFVALGYDVSMIVNDQGQDDIEHIDGIRVIKGFLDRGGIPVIRWLHPRITGLLSALKLADCAHYFDSCAGVSTGIVGYFCKNNNRTHIFRLAHDTDVMPGEQLIRFWRDRKIYEYGLKHANLISAQGTFQQELLMENYGLASVPVNMAVELPTENAGTARDIDVLWVNNLRPFKRPERAVDIARALSEFRVHMIGGPASGYQQLFDDTQKDADTVDNLTFHGAVPYAHVNSYFQRTKVFINTSDSEGFPNSFLQAWIRNVPVISFFDPDGLIAAHGLGGVPRDDEDMNRMVRALLSDEAELQKVGQRCADFARANYSPASIATAYENLIKTLPAQGAK